MILYAQSVADVSAIADAVVPAIAPAMPPPIVPATGTLDPTNAPPSVDTTSVPVHANAPAVLAIALCTGVACCSAGSEFLSP